jgi:LacI family transcriptional regulator
MNNDGTKRLTLKDVAKLAGVAPSTVSFVLNGKAKQMRITDEQAERIMGIVEKSGYEPHRMAVNLRTGQSKTLGLMVESISGSFFATLAKNIEVAAEKLGYNVVYCSTENNTKKGSELINMLSRQMVDGYLITPAPGMEKDILKLVAHRRPVVLMDSYFPDINVPYVLIDNYAGVVQGMEHFISKGYRKIAFITADMKVIQLMERQRGYEDTLRKHKIPVRKKMVLPLPYGMPRTTAIKEITTFIKQNEVDAIFCATNYIGILVIEALSKLQLKMPDDIGVISFDDHDIFRLYPPGITVIQQPIAEIAQTAILLLMNQLDKSKVYIKKSKVQLPGKFIIRGSV